MLVVVLLSQIVLEILLHSSNMIFCAYSSVGITGVCFKWLTTVFSRLKSARYNSLHTSVFVAHAKITQVTSRSNKNNFSSSKASNLFGICSDSFKLRSNMYSNL